MSNLNYESMYNSLKEEYEQCKEDNDELCKEYESTIQLLTESVQKYEKDKKDYQIKMAKTENDVKIILQEKENLIKKNKDKLIDIQCLNEQNEKLNKLIEKYKGQKSIFDNKIVTLENDVEHYQNKIREYEDFIEELKSQLENALEENITLQTEFETYKLNIGEQLMRKEEEIKDIRNDINYKDKMIKKLSQNQKEKLDIKNLQQKLIKDKKFIQTKRRYSVLENSYNKIYIPNNQNLDYNNSTKNSNKINGYNNLKDNLMNPGFATPKDGREADYFKSKFLINTEKKIEERKKEMNGLNAVITQQNEKSEKKIDIKKFEDLEISNEFNYFYIMNNNNNDERYDNYIDRKEEFEKELNNMILNIQKRKKNLLNLKKQINEKMAKLEFRKKY